MADALADLRHRLRSDYPFYAQTVLKVSDRQRLVPFVLRPAQVRFWEALRAQRDAGLPMRGVILKARKLGFSTMGQGLLLQRTTLKPLHRSVIVAHNSATAGAIVEMAETMYRELPDLSDDELILRPPIANRRRNKEIRFGVRSQSGPRQDLGGHHSIFLVDTAKEFEAGRGQTYHSVHGSEVAFWGQLQKKMTALINAVPSDDPDTLMIFETTANGFNEFKEFWDRAVTGESDFHPFFAGWHEDPRYARPMSAVQEDSFEIGEHEFGEDEPHLVAEFDLSPEQLSWRRWAIENLTQSDLGLFRQEYPSFPEEAFLSTGQTVFSGILITRAIRAASKHPEPERATLIAKSKQPRRTRRGMIDVPTAVGAVWGSGDWEIFRRPEASHQYIVACDPATGDSDAAFAIQVIDHQSRAQCAQYEAQVEPDLVAEQLYLACLLYTTPRHPWLAIERTGGYGLALIDTLFHEYGYKQCYTRRKADSATGSYSDRLGWDTTRATKGILHEEAFTLLREGHGIASVRLARQCENYVKKASGRTGPLPGRRSDLLLAWMIAQTVATEKMPRKPKDPSRRRPQRAIRYRVAGY